MSWKEAISKRALRRHHKQRMIGRALKSQRMKNVDSIHRSEVARKWADHLKICSCVYSCGNVRHNPWSSGKVRLTRQEHESLLRMREQTMEIGISEECPVEEETRSGLAQMYFTSRL